ncbi:hypothetical protein V3851_09250 [Paenibacillus sp. M1]|uniref:YbbR-like domain-containing protein n=1 Tax=Paenibacillus haidiansis TaxID=1574488 RepID=A0ABU7VS33_9BACL
MKGFAMKRTPYIYIVVLVLIAGSWGGNLWVYFRSQLREPVFFNHYIEVENSPGYSFDLLYLENKSAKIKLRSIDIPELPNVQVTPIQVQNSYTHQNQGTMRVQIMDYDLLQPVFPPEGPLLIHRVNAVFEDNSVREMNIGEIRVYNDDLTGDAPTEGSSGGSSSLGTGYQTIRFSRAAQLTGITSAYLPRLGDRLAVTLDAASIRNLTQIEIPFESAYNISGVQLSEVPLPLKFAPGDSATLGYGLDLSSGKVSALEKTDVYWLLLRMELTEANGKKTVVPVTLPFSPYLSDRDISEFVRTKGVDS